MAAISQEPLELVLSHYDIQVKSIKNESYKEKKGVWWISTPEGQKILKKISNSEETLKHLLHAVKHLAQKGVLIPKIIETREGGQYAKIDETCFVLWEAVAGKNPSYALPAELSKIVTGMAGFHKASGGFIPLPDSKPKYHLGLWIEDYTQQIEDMNGFYKKELDAPESSAIGKVITREFPYFYERAWKAISGLQGKEYADWVTKAGQAGCLCHQDFAAGNLLLDSSGRLFVLDTDSLTIDIPARDIRKLLNKIMKKSGKWDLSLTQRVLALYQSENPLTASQWAVVKLDLQFPHLFLGAMSKYYYQRDKEWSKEKYLERIKEMAAFEKTAEPVLENYDQIVPTSTFIF